MLKCLRILKVPKRFCATKLQKQNFLTNDYKCSDAWNLQRSSPILEKVNLNDFYNLIDQNYNSKGVINAIDVDIFANAIKDPSYLEELRDVLHKLRLSADTGNTLASTHHATVRNYLEFGNHKDLIEILKDPLTYGIFLDDYAANMLLDNLLSNKKYEDAATVAALVMKQEDYSNSLTTALCLYASYKYIINYSPPEPVTEEKIKVKVEEIKIRVKFLRNPYFDDHFDIKDIVLLSGKTLAWMSENQSDNLSKNLQIIGWLFYEKYDKLQALVEKCSKDDQFKLYKNIADLLDRYKTYSTLNEDIKPKLDKCIEVLKQVQVTDADLKESLRVLIENAINKSQKQDIDEQKQLFKTWSETREEKLNEQINRLDRAKRIQLVQEKQVQLKETEQKLWFFEEEEQIDLKIEEKEKLKGYSVDKKVAQKDDSEYIPPEILPKRK